MSVEQEILVTGIKVVDLLAPYAKGGKIGKLSEVEWWPVVFLLLPCPCHSMDFKSLSASMFYVRIVLAVFPSLMSKTLDFRSSEIAEAIHLLRRKMWNCRGAPDRSLVLKQLFFFSRSVWWCWCRQDCIDHGTDQQCCQSSWWLLSICWCWRKNPWREWFVPWNDRVRCHQLEGHHIQGEQTSQALAVALDSKSVMWVGLICLACAQNWPLFLRACTSEFSVLILAHGLTVLEKVSRTEVISSAPGIFWTKYKVCRY